METKRRSAVKALSWRIWATLITFFVALVITGETSFAVQIGLLDTIIKFVSYFAHERVWVRIRWGHVEEKKSPDYQI